MSIVVGIALVFAFGISGIFSLFPYIRRKRDRGTVLFFVAGIVVFSAIQLYEVSK